MGTQIHPNTIRQLLYLIGLLLLGGFIARELYFLLTPVLGAITFYTIFRKPLLILRFKYQWKKWLSSLVLIFASILLVVIPFGFMIKTGADRLAPVISDPSMIKNALASVSNYIHQLTGFDFPAQSIFNKIDIEMVSSLKDAVGETFSILGVLAMMYFILFFMFYQHEEFELTIKKNLPFRKETVRRLLSSSYKLIYGNAIGIPIVALCQGVVGLIGYWIFGVEDFILFGMLTAIASVIPVVGTMVIYLPLGIYMLATGSDWQGIAVILYGFIIIGSSDNIIRLLLQERLSDAHPLVTIFGVIMGVNVFGFIGVVFGPILLSIFVLLVSIYLEEYGFLNRGHAPSED